MNLLKKDDVKIKRTAREKGCGCGVEWLQTTRVNFMMNLDESHAKCRM